MLDHLRHMAATRPEGMDRDAARWALREIEQLEFENKAKFHSLEFADEQIERLTAQRDEWQQKWMALAQASLLAGTMRLGSGPETQ